MRPRTLRPALLGACVCLVAGCAMPASAPGSWGPAVADASPLPPRTLLEVAIVGAVEGDLERTLRTAIAEARVGPTSSSTFTLSVRARERHVGGVRVHVASLHFTLVRDGIRVAEDEVSATAGTTTEARRLAVARLLARASAALAAQEAPRRGPTQRFELPAIVVVERVAHSRDLLELSFVETVGGAVLRREIVPLADAAAGPPGRFVLSRRTVEGRRLDDEGYAALVRQTSPFLDLRPIGEAQRMGYFGPKAPLTPAAGSAASPRTSTPPRR